MWSRQIFVALLSLCLTLQHAAGVVNSGQTKKTEEPVKSGTETQENDKPNKEAGDLVAESSEKANRREAPAILDSYGAPALPSSILPVPIYGAPNAPSNNVIYPAPPPDIPPPPPKPAALYGAPSFGKIYGVPQVPLVSKGYGPPSLPVKYGAPTINFNQYPVNLGPPKQIYGPPKTTYGVPAKPYKYFKFPQKNFGLRPPKPIYGAPLSIKDNFSFNKLNHLNTNNFYTSSNSLSNLYSGVSTLSHQYGAPVLPPKIQYAHVPIATSQYGVPEKLSISPGAPLVGYGPPQPSPNPKPPHPGAPAPPTPPDIKYDGWQPIPGLVSKRPVEVSGDGSGYHDLSPPPLNIGHNHLSETYGAPSITLDVSHGNSLIDSSSSKGVSDSYSAPLGTVTGSGGVVTSSGDEAHGGGSHSNTHSSSHAISLDLSTIGIGHGSDIQAVKSIEYDLTPQGGNSLSDSYGAPQAAAVSFGNSHSISGFSQKGQKSFSGSTIGLVPPSGVYGAPPSNQYGPPLFTNGGSSYKNFHKGLFTNSYLPPSPPVAPSVSYGAPSSGAAISFQNVAHGSSTAGIDLQHSALNIEGASALPLSSYNVPLGSIDGSYSIPASSSANEDITVSLDFSHPPVSIDLTGGESKHSPQQAHDCYKQQLQVPSLAYGVPSIDSYTSSLSSLTTNIENSHAQSISPQATYGAPQLPSAQYGAPDLVHSSSIKNEAKVNAVSAEEDEGTHGKTYGKSVAASFGPNSELVESQSLDLNNIPLQGSLGSYTLQIQSADGAPGQVPHNQLLNEGLLQSILQAIEQPGKQGQDSKYPIILQPSVEQGGYSVNETVSTSDESKQEASEIREVIVDAPSSANSDAEDKNSGDPEETLQLLDTSNIALYYKKDDGNAKADNEDKAEENSVDDETNN